MARVWASEGPIQPVTSQASGIPHLPKKDDDSSMEQDSHCLGYLDFQVNLETSLWGGNL